MKKIIPTGAERFFDSNDIIVSKTDLKGRITYANDVFLKIAGYTETEVLGAPHCILRHPEMPRCVFKLLWDSIGSGKEIFAYVVNICKNGDHYWVLAHVTPSFDAQGNVSGYHSNRRVPSRNVINQTIVPMYRSLKEIEDSAPNSKDGLERSFSALEKILQEKGVRYDQFIFSLAA